jgi:hypothetical protein
LKSAKPCPGPGTSVQIDWCGWMPDAKLHAFRLYSSEFEACYTMLSVSLDEAISLRESGLLRKSFQIVDVTPALCSRFSGRLQGLLTALDEHAKHYGIVPSVAPLNAANFKGSRGQRSARMNAVLSRVLLTQRAQFLNKINSLRDMVSELASNFRLAAEDLASGAVLDGGQLWMALDHNHFDLNTCFRETMVLLKCFLRVLPDDQLLSFQKTVDSQLTPRQPKSPRRVIRHSHRRIHQFAGE